MSGSQSSGTVQQAPKSPPLAFQTTSNDALWAPSRNSLSVPSLTSPPMPHPLASHVSESELDMQAQIDKQAEALRLQHQAFMAERESWQFEKDRLYRRITSLESLLKGTASGHRLYRQDRQHMYPELTRHSPARSPIISPHSGNLYSPPSMRTATPQGISRLASIAEIEAAAPHIENRRPSPVLKRVAAPKRIDLSSISTNDMFDGEDTVDADKTHLPVDGAKPDLIDDVPRSPPQSRAKLSPPPLKYRHLAGHTPLRGSIAGPISPALSTFSEHVDTPTRSNTTLNETLTANDPDDRPLKGPLMMPELPNQPGEENFTMSMLEAKLQDMVEHPEESEPMVMKSPSPGLNEVSQADELDKTNIETTVQPKNSESKSTSPQATKGADQLDGGIKLRKKPSCNFGAPLGQMHPMWKH